MLQTRPPMERSTGDHDACRTAGCKIRKLEGSDYCPMHGAHQQLNATAKNDLYQFQVGQYLFHNKQDMDEHKYDLSNELGVTRVILQKHLEKITDEASLGLYNNKVNQQIDRIQKLVESCLKADQKLGTLMSEEDTVMIAQGLLDAVHDVLSSYVSNKAELATAMETMVETFKRIIGSREQSS